MAKNVNLEVFRKTTKNYLLRFTENGTAKDISGWTVYFTVKEKISDDDSLAKINHNVTAHQDPTGGKSLIILTQTDTDRIGSYHYDICGKDIEGNVFVLYYGRIRFKQKTTNRA